MGLYCVSLTRVVKRIAGSGPPIQRSLNDLEQKHMTHSSELERFYQRRSRYYLHKLFWVWPTVTSVDDVERVTALGFWVCVAFGVSNVVTLPSHLANAEGFGEKAFTLIGTPAFFLSYYLGANALRQRSVAAATMLTMTAFIIAAGDRKMHGFYDLQFTSQALLLLNVLRGIYLAARYCPAPDEGPPLNKTFMQIFPFSWGRVPWVITIWQSLVDRLPQRIWPRFRVAFWILSSLQLGVSLLGVLPDRAILFLLDILHL